MEYVESKPFLAWSSEVPLRRSGWGSRGILFLCLIKTDVECSKCFPQIQSFLGKRGRFLPILSRQWHVEGNDSPRPAIWIPRLPQRTVGSQLSLSRVGSRAGRHSPLSPLGNSLGFLVLSTYFLSAALPAGLLRAAGLCHPLLLQPACLLACFQGIQRLAPKVYPARFHLLSLFSSWGKLSLAIYPASISCPSFCGEQPGNSSWWGFWGLGMALLLQKQTSWDIFYFTSQLEKAQLNKPTYKKDENKATKSPGYLKNNEK